MNKKFLFAFYRMLTAKVLSAQELSITIWKTGNKNDPKAIYLPPIIGTFTKAYSLPEIRNLSPSYTSPQDNHNGNCTKDQ